MQKPAFLIAAPKSNSGKTLITMGLIRALTEKGLKVQPFKCGPDYIDPMHHSGIAGRASYNLDMWMASESHVKLQFQQQMQDADIGVVEGVMGLFDGARKDEGSSAAIARLLDISVMLVVDASSVAFSVAPLLYGFKNFDSRVRLAGVIFNKVAGESHYRFLKEAADTADVPSLGYIPRHADLAIEDRHLGLYMPGESSDSEIVKKASELIFQHVNLDELIERDGVEIPKIYERTVTESSTITVAMASDAAFNFTYRANLDVLEKLGEVKYFSPLNDKAVPEADLIWLPGGYPELHTNALSANQSMLQSIRNCAESGKAIIAECGGMMYLGKSLITKDGEAFEMSGLFDFSTSFENMKLHLGYREVSKDGLKLKGHEFHYSELKNQSGGDNYQVKTARGKTLDMPVFRYKNVWASYLHLYLGEEDKMKEILSHLIVNSIKL